MATITNTNPYLQQAQTIHQTLTNFEKQISEDCSRFPFLWQQIGDTNRKLITLTLTIDHIANNKTDANVSPETLDKIQEKLKQSFQMVNIFQLNQTLVEDYLKYNFELAQIVQTQNDPKKEKKVHQLQVELKAWCQQAKQPEIFPELKFGLVNLAKIIKKSLKTGKESLNTSSPNSMRSNEQEQALLQKTLLEKFAKTHQKLGKDLEKDFELALQFHMMTLSFTLPHASSYLSDASITLIATLSSQTHEIVQNLIKVQQTKENEQELQQTSCNNNTTEEVEVEKPSARMTRLYERLMTFHKKTLQLPPPATPTPKEINNNNNNSAVQTHANSTREQDNYGLMLPLNILKSVLAALEQNTNNTDSDDSFGLLSIVEQTFSFKATHGKQVSLKDQIQFHERTIEERENLANQRLRAVKKTLIEVALEILEDTVNFGDSTSTKEILNILEEIKLDPKDKLVEFDCAAHRLHLEFLTLHTEAINNGNNRLHDPESAIFKGDFVRNGFSHFGIGMNSEIKLQAIHKTKEALKQAWNF